MKRFKTYEYYALPHRRWLGIFGISLLVAALASAGVYGYSRYYNKSEQPTITELVFHPASHSGSRTKVCSREVFV